LITDFQYIFFIFTLENSNQTMQLAQGNPVEIDSQLHLRPRFELFSAIPLDNLKERFNEAKDKLEPDFKIKVIGNYIYLGIGLVARKNWSPNLQLELEAYEDGRTHIRGVFGPDPVLWTLFMFLHFVVAGIFLIFGVIAYSKYNLNEPCLFDLVIMFIMTNIWFLLYYIARYNRSRGLQQAESLEKIMRDLLE
jgi:hypothetical protein